MQAEWRDGSQYVVVPGVFVHGNPLRIAAGHDAGTGGSTNARGNAEMGELAAFCSHPVQMRRAMQGRAEGLDIAVAQIVAENDNEVGFSFFSSD